MRLDLENPGALDVSHDELEFLVLRTNIMKATFLTRYDKTRKHIEFSNSLQIATAGSGCFEIDTGNDFMDVDKLLIGMSLDDPDGSSIPVPVVAVSIPLYFASFSSNSDVPLRSLPTQK